MDKHYLTPLLSPESIVVMAGRHDDPSSQTRHGRALCAALRAQRFGGQLHFVDTGTSGTLADLAKTRADLAVIALPPAEVPPFTVGPRRCRRSPLDQGACRLEGRRLLLLTGCVNSLGECPSIRLPNPAPALPWFLWSFASRCR